MVQLNESVQREPIDSISIAAILQRHSIEDV